MSDDDVREAVQRLRLQDGDILLVPYESGITPEQVCQPGPGPHVPVWFVASHDHMPVVLDAAEAQRIIDHLRERYPECR